MAADGELAYPTFGLQEIVQGSKRPRSSGEERKLHLAMNRRN
jgi:hypothetical protein